MSRLGGGGGTHRADREPLLRAAGENSTGEPAAATPARFFLPPGRERGLGAALPRFLRAEPPGVRGEAGAENMVEVKGMERRATAPALRSRRAPADRVTAGRSGERRSPCGGRAETPRSCPLRRRAGVRAPLYRLSLVQPR